MDLYTIDVNGRRNSKEPNYMYLIEDDVINNCMSKIKEKLISYDNCSVFYEYVTYDSSSKATYNYYYKIGESEKLLYIRLKGGSPTVSYIPITFEMGIANQDGVEGGQILSQMYGITINATRTESTKEGDDSYTYTYTLPTIRLPIISKTNNLFCLGYLVPSISTQDYFENNIIYMSSNNSYGLGHSSSNTYKIYWNDLENYVTIQSSPLTQYFFKDELNAVYMKLPRICETNNQIFDGFIDDCAWITLRDANIKYIELKDGNRWRKVYGLSNSQAVWILDN